MKRLAFSLSVAFLTVASFGQNQVLQLFQNNRYEPVPWTEIEVFELSDNQETFEARITTQSGKSLNVTLGDSILFQTGYSIPHLAITTREELTEIPDKVNYKEATIDLRGFGGYEDVVADVNIKGRGNTSWDFDKKPYRLKFDKKISLCGLPKAKSYVLLANWTDASLLQFAVATHIAKMLELPYTNTVIPVDVTLNGIYKGSYMLTNKPGINAGSVDIDETNSIMWEMDVSYDEARKFKSDFYNLPVMAVDPELTDEAFEKWKADFNEMEKAAISIWQTGVSRGPEYVDLDNFARYLLVYEIMNNGEIGWPKSAKMYKTEGEKYKFGPVWDFDNACGYNWATGESYTTDGINNPSWINYLFDDFTCEDEFNVAIKTHWNFIKENQNEIFEFIDQYASMLQNSARRNQSLWPHFTDWDQSVSNLKNYLKLRMQAIDNFEMMK